MVGLINGSLGRCTDEWMDREKIRSMQGQTIVDGQSDRLKDKQIDLWEYKLMGIQTDQFD